LGSSEASNHLFLKVSYTQIDKKVNKLVYQTSTEDRKACKSLYFYGPNSVYT